MKDLRYFWLLSRPVNLLIGALTFTLAAYISGLHSLQFVHTPLFWHQLVLLLVIMATGYWINDVYDRRIDLVNKPSKTVISIHISAKKVLTGYVVAVMGVCVACLWLPLKFQLLNAGALAALFIYASYLKRQAILGNLIIAVLAALVVLAGAFVFYLKLALLWGMIFAFLVTFIREVVKDVEDMRGDMQHNLRTFPILMGIGATKRLLAIFYSVLVAACVLPLPAHYLLDNQWLKAYMLYQLVFVIPLILFARVRLSWARLPSDFRQQSLLLKIVMLLGMISLLLLPYQ